MSLGIPCVASDYGGNTHMVKNEVNGLLFPQKNAPALAEALMRLYDDRDLYAKCSFGAYKRYSEEFNARAMTQKMMNIYYNEYLKSKYKKLRLQQ
jgi:glycosyltransferase involved in cell wall biosynthesis